MERVDRIKLWIFIILRATVVVAVVIAGVKGDWNSLALSVVTMALLFVPSMLEKRLKLDFPSEFDIVIVVFIYSAMFLGEISSFYDRFWWWDVFLHTFSGLIIGAVGFSLVYILNSHENVAIRLSPVFVCIFSFCFALAMDVIWEIYEYGMDQIFGFNMQKSGLQDTMWDLIVDTLGAAAFSILGYFYLKGKIRILSRFTERSAGKSVSMGVNAGSHRELTGAQKR